MTSTWVYCNVQNDSTQLTERPNYERLFLSMTWRPIDGAFQFRFPSELSCGVADSATLLGAGDGRRLRSRSPVAVQLTSSAAISCNSWNYFQLSNLFSVPWCSVAANQYFSFLFIVYHRCFVFFLTRWFQKIPEDSSRFWSLRVLQQVLAADIVIKSGTWSSARRGCRLNTRPIYRPIFP